MVYVGTDDPERGGEVLIEGYVPEGNLPGFGIDLGPLGTGLFIPD